MMIFVSLLTVLLCHFYFTFGANAVPNANVSTLTWPANYHLKGEYLYITGGVTEPFEMWYRKKSRRSRQDLYGGLIKNYYVVNFMGSFSYSIHSEATREGKAVRKCGIAQQKKDHVKNFLPNVEGFVYKGQVNDSDRVLQLWEAEKVNISENAIRRYNLYVYKFDKYHIPARQEYKRYDLLSGGLVFHQLTLYYNFNSTVSSRDVSVKRSPDATKCLALETVPGRPDQDDEGFDIGESFHGFKNIHDKKYKATEHELRKNIFENNLRYIAKHNKKDLGYYLKATSFADQSDEELESTGCILPLDSNKFGSEYVSFKNDELDAITDENLPEALDLRMKGLINSVRNQLACGSCWTFSTTGTVEGALAIKNGGRLLDLSEQSILDCAWGYNNYGCRGGLLDHAFKYILDQGIPTEREYGSYLMEEGKCKISNMTEVYKIRGFGQLTVGSATALRAALNKYGPVAVSIFAGKNMRLYSSGIFYDPTCNDHRRNHAVIVVGYGTRDDNPYWIVKNSWGESWGEGGYILMSARDNNCHLLNEMYYAVA